MSVGSITPFKFIFKSDENDKLLDLSTFPLIAWHKALTLDDIFKFYSYLELEFNDETGVVSDLIVSAEGAIFTSDLGYEREEKDGYLSGKWVWDSNQVVGLKKATHLRGNHIISFLSSYFQKDSIKSRAWNDNLYNVVADVIKKDFGLVSSDKKVFITKSLSKIKNNNYYQINETTAQFLVRLTERAYSDSFEYSPFVTFTNSAGEFYFCALEELFNTSELISPDTYMLINDEDASISAFSIQNLNVIQSGFSINKPSYKKKVYRRKEDGTSEGKVTTIQDHLITSSGKGSILVRKNNLNFQKNEEAFDYVNFGITNGDKDDPMYKGFRNNLFLNSSLYMRMNATIRFNPKAVTGKSINIEIGSTIKEKNNKSSEYCGKWLIISSKSCYDKNGQPYNILQICKNRVVVDSVNLINKDFIS
jgi:hypothetical protein